MKRINKLSKKAFTLIEISVACVVLILILFNVFLLMQQGNKGTVHNRNEIIAKQYASNIIAYYNLIPFKDVVPLDEFVLKNENGFNVNIDEKMEASFKNLEPQKKCSVRIEPYKNDDWPYEYKFVTVTVEWKEPGKTKNEKVTMTGLVAER